VSVRTSFTKLTINFFYLIYYLRYLITKSLPLNHLVAYCSTNSNWHNRATTSGGDYSITTEDGRVRPKHVDD
jgi:hypothetical protein